MLRIIKFTGPDIMQGNGVRCTIWVSGCKHHCPMCHNQWTQDFSVGRTYSYNEKADEIWKYLSKPFYDGITLSGGDPLSQDNDGLREILDIIHIVRTHFPKKNIWLYTGYSLEEIRNHENGLVREIVDKVDVLVDGRFEIDKKDISLAFRGSSNQVIWERGADGEFVRSNLN